MQDVNFPSPVELFWKTMTSQIESSYRSEHTPVYQNKQKEGKMTYGDYFAFYKYFESALDTSENLKTLSDDALNVPKVNFLTKNSPSVHYLELYFSSFLPVSSNTVSCQWSMRLVYHIISVTILGLAF